VDAENVGTQNAELEDARPKSAGWKIKDWKTRNQSKDKLKRHEGSQKRLTEKYYKNRPFARGSL